ncbi:MAG: tRNA pseudouridine(54/55) synthase Pus10 [Candidatus Micrarchaeota archaeon]|nr:tRNA pseudouridine(54/55) synthase Pus10 [Candidatus Micrarchaeota archaeon]
MPRFGLCGECAGRFSGAKCVEVCSDAKRCHICAGSLKELPKLAKEAVSQSGKFEWGTFSVSSSFPRQVLVHEHEVADWVSPGNYSSLKNNTNAELAKAVEALTGKKCVQRGADASFEFDFSSLRASAKPSQVYVFGHYLKLSRKHCQSRWHCSECEGRGCASCGGSGMNYPSVEDELGREFCAAFEAKSCTLHASGREDVDVRALGTGRPFVLQIISPKKRSPDLHAVEALLAANENVRAVGLKKVSKGVLDAVCNSHFDKVYVAVVSADRPLTDADAKKLDELTGKTINQQTPKRVLARRVDIIRPRKVHSLSATTDEDGALNLLILAEAGTYIKELVNSDGNRTKPSVSSILGCPAVCVQLDVVEIKDYFLKTIFDLCSPRPEPNK